VLISYTEFAMPGSSACHDELVEASSSNFLVRSFCLNKKEPKIQECRIASGRHSTQRSYVATLQMALQSSYCLTLLLPTFFEFTEPFAK
jgi:hypothetical protein